MAVWSQDVADVWRPEHTCTPCAYNQLTSHNMEWLKAIIGFDLSFPHRPPLTLRQRIPNVAAGLNEYLSRFKLLDRSHQLESPKHI